MNVLSFRETEIILSKYKIPFCKTEIFNSKEKAFLFAKKVGFPVALKIHGQKVFHKSELGGVKINVNEDNFYSVWDQIIKNVEGKIIEGILVQEMVCGKEVALGMNRDDQFGPTIMFGLGGIFIEIIKDVSLRVVPIDKNEAIKMIKEIKGFKILDGLRGGEKVDINKLADMLVNISNLSLKEENIKSIDFNPVIINKSNALVTDFRIIV
ncbi:MAG: acetate--CoA ligase family protein [Candidatus Paceibacterota bacterium]|jgi:acyl-CoA synthetase (NDP forming)